MENRTLHLDLRQLAPDQQVARLKECYLSLRGTGIEVHARVEDRPARPYISLLERGYRVYWKHKNAATWLILRPDGSIPRLGVRGAHSIACHPDGRVYANTTDQRVAVLDGSTRRLLRHIAVGDNPSHLEISHDGRRVYVANTGSDDVTVIDTLNDRIESVVSVGKRPLLPCVAPNGRSVYLPSGPDRSVTILAGDGHAVKTLAVGDAPHDIAVSPDGRYGFVANTLSDDVSVLETANHEVVATIGVGKGAHLPAVSPDGRFGYVADFAADDLTIWETRDWSIVGRIAVGIYPHFFAISPDGQWLVVSNTGEASVCIIAVPEHEVRARLIVGGAPGHIAFDCDSECAFVACERTNEVAVVDIKRLTLIESVDAGGPLQ